jgi:hypothetical protein
MGSRLVVFVLVRMGRLAQIESEEVVLLCWYCSKDVAQMPRWASPAPVMVYILRAGPPLEVSQLDSTMPSFSIGLSVRYKVLGFMALKPKAEARSISS